MFPFRFSLTSSLLITTLLFAATGCERTETTETQSEIARPAKIVPVLPASISVLRTYPGTLEASKKAELAFRVGGQLSDLPVQAGDWVKKGDLLARLDEAVYQNTVDERQARFELAKIQHEQASKMVKKNLTSQLQYDQAATELKLATAALERARDDLEYTRLLAPFEGVVARVDIENHQAIQAKTPIIKLQDDSMLDIRFSVPESLISHLKQSEHHTSVQGFCGAVHFASHEEKTYRACHRKHESVPDPVTRNYSAVFSLEKIKDFAALPGMTATIELDFSTFLLEDAARGLLIPLEAVFEQDGSQWVWVVDADSRARKTRVDVGVFEGGMLEISAGLTANDKVIAAGVSHIRESMLVAPIVKERGL